MRREIHDYLKKIYLMFPEKYKKNAKDFYYGPLYIASWMPKNLFVGVIRRFYRDKTIKNLNFFEQTFYSQSGEDGIIKTIFDKIGTTNKFCIEFGISKNQGNTINLKRNGWDCLWMDWEGDGEIIKKEYITRENIEFLFRKWGVPKEPDLLSIDLDSNDYWIWDSIKNYSPRVILIEYNANISIKKSVSVGYDLKNCWNKVDDYYGASLLALYKLGKIKGYTLIGCNELGVNAFFLRDDLIKNNFKIKSLEKTYRKPKYGKKINGIYSGYKRSKRKMVKV